VKLAGGPLRALILNATVVASSRTLTITFVPIVGSIAVNAFEIYEIVPRQYATLNENGT